MKITGEINLHDGIIDIDIHNAREADINFGSNNLTLLNHKSKVFTSRDNSRIITNSEKIAEVYYNELADIMMDTFKPDIVLCHSHRIRSSNHLPSGERSENVNLSETGKHFNLQENIPGPSPAAYRLRTVKNQCTVASSLHNDYHSAMEPYIKALILHSVGLTHSKLEKSTRRFNTSRLWLNRVINPNSILHKDYTVRFAPGINKQSLADADWSTVRTACYNSWRNLGPEHPDNQFMLEGSGNIDVLKTCEVRKIFEDSNYQTLTIHRDCTQLIGKYYYYPNLQPDELILFNIWDSQKFYQNKSWASIHTGFRLKEKGLPHRTSIDCNCLLGWLN